MSYINEALKKAQKERDTLHIQYSGVLEGSRKERRTFGNKGFWYSLLLLILIFLVFTSYSWLDLPDSKIFSTPEFKSPAKIGLGESDTDTKNLYNKARHLDKKGHFQDAKKLYKEVISLDPGYIEVLNNLGIIYIREKDYIAAKHSFNKAILLNPGSVESYYNLACLHAIEGEVRQGLVYLKKATSLDNAVRGWARDDSDLKNLRALPEFNDIIAE
ncbi:tetratricopeptide repeat protein [Thermodesulfobacteriota bacterium]